MNTFDRAFYPGRGVQPELPLGRFLPPIPRGAVADWLRDNLPAGSWLLDPIGANPMVAIEAAQAGYRVLVSCNNPVLVLMFKVLSRAAPLTEYQSVLAALGASRYGEERTARQMEMLYQTECANCGEVIHPQAFIWQADQTQPYARLYSCPHCNDQGEHLITSADLERLTHTGSDTLHRTRALSRVLQDTHPEQREQIESALRTYLPRPLSVITTLINRRESLSLTAEREDLLTALLLTLCDDGNTLWGYPSIRSRPRQLIIPSQFRENNLWLGLDEAMIVWNQANSTPVELVIWPQRAPESGGISLFPGRIKSLLPLAEDIHPSALVSAAPRANQAFWTLCAVWSGWLWGKESVAPLRGALERSRYDWYWMTHALHSTLSAPNQQLAADTPLFLLASELSMGYLLSLMVAPSTAGFDLDGLAIDTEDDLAQFWWHSGQHLRSPTDQSPKAITQQALISHLQRRGEPANSVTLFNAGLAAQASVDLLPTSISDVPNDLFARSQSTLGEVLKNRSIFTRFASRNQSDETAKWWLVDSAQAEPPLSDQVEREIVLLLTRNSPVTRRDIDQSIYSIFSGMLTPSDGLITACLESYAQRTNAVEETWRLNDHETPIARREDVTTMVSLLEQLALRFGFHAEGKDPLFWKIDSQQSRYLFYVIGSSIISRFVFEDQPLPPEKCVIVLPGSRSSLINMKIERDPRLAAALQSGWRLLKFRHLRQLAKKGNLTLPLWEELIDGDPPRWDDATQMTMF